MMAEKLSLIGRDRVLVEKVAKLLHGAVKKHHNYTVLRETPRGNTFELDLIGPDKKPTGHIVRVTVELDRVEQT